MNEKMQKVNIEKTVLGAVMTALVIILQLLGSFTTFFGPFSTALALIPIVIGAATCGIAVGGWLGFVFGATVLFSGGGALFWAFNIPGTIITVLVKGMACGLAAGAVYKLLSKRHKPIISVIASALVCPVVNTAVFLLGCAVFFLGYADAIAETLGMNVSGMALFFALAMGNFAFEVGLNIVLSPVIVRILNARKMNKV